MPAIFTINNDHTTTHEGQTVARQRVDHTTPLYDKLTLAIVKAIIDQNLLFQQQTIPTLFDEKHIKEAFKNIHADNHTALENTPLSSRIIQVLQPFINHSRHDADRPRTLEEQNRAHAILFTVYGLQAWLTAIDSNCQQKLSTPDNFSTLATTPS